MRSFHQFRARMDRLLRHTIWRPSALADRSPHGRFMATLRIGAITWTGLNENRVFTRAAALSYSTLLGFGPVVAIAILVAGFALDTEDPDIAVQALNRVIRFLAPQVEQYELATQIGEFPDHRLQAADEDQDIPVNPQLVSLINNFIEGSRSAAAGAIGGSILIVIVIQMFTAIENTFNAIWGVRQGRSWITRVMVYWTLVTLGAVVIFGGLTLLTASTLANLFGDLPMGGKLLSLMQWSGPLASFLLLVIALTLFYRLIPNTKVFWTPAFIGAGTVVVLLFINHFLAFLYFRRAIMSESLYGSLGIIPILMVGLYVFWAIVLVGGQLTYAIQNANFRSSRAAWNELNEQSRESLSLLVLLFIARRFKSCEPPYTASQLGSSLSVPTQLLNESLNRLTDLGLITGIPPEPDETAMDYRYQPARPLNRITLREFKQGSDTFGQTPETEAMVNPDPLLRRYRESLDKSLRQAFDDTTLEEFLRSAEDDEKSGQDNSPGNRTSTGRSPHQKA